MTKEERDAIRARCEAATPGPWLFDSYCRVKSVPLGRKHRAWEKENLPADCLEAFTDADWKRVAATEPETKVCEVPRLAGDTATEQGAADAHFIANARADVPALLVEMARLRTALLEAYEACARMCDEESLAAFGGWGNPDTPCGAAGIALHEMADAIREAGARLP